MVKIKQVGVVRMASGKIDGITYVTRGDVTFARSTPRIPHGHLLAECGIQPTTPSGLLPARLH